MAEQPTVAFGSSALDDKSDSVLRYSADVEQLPVAVESSALDERSELELRRVSKWNNSPW
jgi:hypothetical protein